MKETVILYHAECPDGFGAAWAAHKKFGDKAEYIGVQHNGLMPKGLENKELYFTDFSYGEEEMAELIKKNRRVTAIDHHITREKAVKMTQDYSYSIDNSGSVLAWKYFHKDEPVPELLKFVEDRDLFKFSLSQSRAFCAFLDTLDFDFKVWDKISEDMKDSVKYQRFLSQGRAIKKYEEELVKKLFQENSREVTFENYETFAANVPHMFASDVGYAIYTAKPPIAITWYEGKDNIHVSLRSDGTVDVSELAKKYGGGGHRTSAGFELKKIEDKPWKEIK